MSELTTQATEMLPARMGEPGRQSRQVFLATSLVTRGSRDPSAEGPGSPVSRGQDL
ncbi:hypothetical protein ACFYT4_05020 [Streptomyces sp. NPDC004609]|uniref:hypothetical protein n=1 Tax=Streptomyces sp. NPDC004609 TaxID=3364704 RepID=UPI0036BFF3E6